MTATQAKMFNIVTLGYEFTGADGVTYKVIGKNAVRLDDAEVTAYYVTVTDGTNTHVIDLDELV
jgi:hypothetical protein